MELHDHLYSLGLQHGRDLLDDADRLREVLDGLPAGSTVPDDVEVVVTAVRDGALSDLRAALDRGTAVPLAITESAARHAEPRTTWALAALAFALGRATDADVHAAARPGNRLAEPTRLPSSGLSEVTRVGPGRPMAASSTAVPAPPTAPPSAPASAPPSPWAPVAPPTLLPPAPAPAAPPAAPPSAPVPPAPIAPAPMAPMAPPPARRRPGWPIALAAGVVAALLIGAIGVGAVWLFGDDDAPTAGSDTSDTTGAGVTGEAADLPMEFEAIDERYAALAGLVTTGVESCESVGAMAGQTERLECVLADGLGSLSLATWEHADDLAADRSRSVELAVGSRFHDSGDGVLLGQDATSSSGGSAGGGAATRASLYWDSTSGLASARYAAPDGVALDDVVALFDSTRPAVAYPTKPSDEELLRFARQWIDTRTCERIQTLVPGETEESRCDVDGPVEVYIGRFDDLQSFRAYRRAGLERAREAQRDLRTWNQNEGDPTEGALYEYRTDGGTAVRYWDQPDCLCYAEAYLGSGSYADLYDWWLT